MVNLIFLDSSKLYELDYVTLSGINCLYQVNKKSNRKDKPYWLTCTIADSSNNMENSNELNNLFANWIRETIAKHEKPRELIKRSDLTEEDFNKIHVSNYINYDCMCLVHIILSFLIIIVTFMIMLIAARAVEL